MRAVLADLDDTLFDHAHATRQALARLHEMEPSWSEWSRHDLEARHGDVLELLHVEVLTGRLTVEAARIERFRRLLAAGPSAERAVASRAIEIAAEYRAAYEQAWQPVPGAPELLDALTASGIRVVVVTNNLQAEQRLKIDRCGLARHVEVLVTSEEIGVPKPDRAIFSAALRGAGASAAEAVMLGDAWLTDIEGARRSGIRAVWFNRLRAERPDTTVPELRSLVPTREALRVLRGV